jgi:hypothetical protein
MDNRPRRNSNNSKQSKGIGLLSKVRTAAWQVCKECFLVTIHWDMVAFFINSGFGFEASVVCLSTSERSSNNCENGEFDRQFFFQLLFATTCQLNGR